MLNQNETSIQEPGVRMLNQNETSIQEPGVRSQNAQPERDEYSEVRSQNAQPERDEYSGARSQESECSTRAKNQEPALPLFLCHILMKHDCHTEGIGAHSQRFGMCDAETSAFDALYFGVDRL